jgi:hypothetical protein
MLTVLLAEDLTGNLLAIPIEKVEYIREGGAYTEIYTSSGETFQVQTPITELQIVQLEPTRMTEASAEGATPTEEITA